VGRRAAVDYTFLPTWSGVTFTVFVRSHTEDRRLDGLIHDSDAGSQCVAIRDAE
jgi:hypothetical protein